MSVNAGMMSSNTDDWETPASFFSSMVDKYGVFDVDVCASATNAKCAVFYDKAQDGLKQPWIGKCWMNPPYGRDIKLWMKKAYEASKAGATVVCLVPARTDTAWWHDYAMHGEITFIRGRLKFGTSVNSAPFPSAVVVFKGVTHE